MRDATDTDADERSGPHEPTPSSKPRPSRRSPRSTVPSKLVPRLVVTAVLALVFSAFALLGGWLLESRRGPATGASLPIAVAAGDTLGSLSDTLEQRGLIKGVSLFSLYLRLSGRGDTPLRAGQHLLPDNLTARELASCLARDGKCPAVKVTFPEGWNRFEMAKRLQEKGIVPEPAFLAATIDKSVLADLDIQADSAEGYLFPATYALSLDADAREVVKTMKGEFDRRLLKVRSRLPNGATPAITDLGWGWHDVVTLASIVEKEAAVDEERATIASVFLNRLLDPTFTPHLLQSDPTAVYGCLVAPQLALSCATFTGKATPAIVHDPANRYSTYAFQGLPPGPIANPGERSLQAVLAPAESHYLYFVAKGGGRHAFSSTLAEHNDAIRRLRDARK